MGENFTGGGVVGEKLGEEKLWEKISRIKSCGGDVVGAVLKEKKFRVKIYRVRYYGRRSCGRRVR